METESEHGILKNEVERRTSLLTSMINQANKYSDKLSVTDDREDVTFLEEMWQLHLDSMHQVHEHNIIDSSSLVLLEGVVSHMNISSNRILDAVSRKVRSSYKTLSNRWKIEAESAIRILESSDKSEELDITRQMTDNMESVIIEKIGRHGEKIEVKVLEDLWENSWKTILGPKAITVNESAREKLSKLGVLDNGTYNDLIAIRNNHHRHHFMALFSEVIDSELPSSGKSEKDDQSYIAKYTNAVVTVMSSLMHQCGSVKLSANSELSISKELDDNFSASASQAKRIKTSSGSCSSYSTGGSISKKKPFNPYTRRPDICILDHKGITRFSCEVKKSKTLQKDADKQLFTFAHPFDSCNLNIHRSFGATFTGHIFELYYFEQRGLSLEKYLLQTYDLNIPIVKIKLLTHMIMLYFIISVVSANQQGGDLATFFRPTCMVQFTRNKLGTCDSLRKVVDLQKLAVEFGFNADEQLARLTKFYELIKINGNQLTEWTDASCPIKHSLRCLKFQFVDDDIKKINVHLFPVGVHLNSHKELVKKDVDRFVSHVLAFLDSLHRHGYTHQDIRLRNIIFYPSKSVYLVIDYENIEPLSNWPPKDYDSLKNILTNELGISKRAAARHHKTIDIASATTKCSITLPNRRIET